MRHLTDELTLHPFKLYCILWRAQGSDRPMYISTSRTKIEIEDLQPGLLYKLVIKAGNSNGTSQITPELEFITTKPAH